jgi:two-component system OmpR family response regulator
VRNRCPQLIRVFLVEDLLRLHGLLSELFESIGGCEVLGVASTEAEAMAWLEEHRDACDLVVVDLMLEQGSGIGVITRCKATQAAAHIVVFSAYASGAVARHCVALGANEVIDKEDSWNFVQYCAGFAATH